MANNGHDWLGLSWGKMFERNETTIKRKSEQEKSQNKNVQRKHAQSVSFGVRTEKRRGI